MEFREVNSGDYVKFSSSLYKHEKNNALPIEWAHENKHCWFEVRMCYELNGEKNILIECVQACDTHLVSAISETEYKDISKIIGAPLFESCDLTGFSFNQQATFKESEARKISIKEEAMKISKYLDENIAHRELKRTG